VGVQLGRLQIHSVLGDTREDDGRGPATNNPTGFSLTLTCALKQSVGREAPFLTLLLTVPKLLRNSKPLLQANELHGIDSNDNINEVQWRFKCKDKAL
jgi:hypothetical protein